MTNKIFPILLVLTILFMQSCVSTKDTNSRKRIIVTAPDSGRIYHCIYPSIDGSDYKSRESLIEEYESLSGSSPVWISFSDNWFKGIKFPSETAGLIEDFGYIPMIRMLPWSGYNIEKHDPVFDLEKITKGKFDTELIQYAKDVLEFGKPVIIAFGVEMNGNWFPWSGYFNGSSKDGAANYKSAYKHIIDIFRREGVLNVTWAFHPNYNSQPNEEWNKMIEYYPGDDYIDWIGISIYGAQKQSDNRKTFDEEMTKTYNELTKISGNKPLALFELGVIETGTPEDKAGWIRGAFLSLTSNKYPLIKAVTWWHSDFENKDGKMSRMRIDSSPEALKEYRLWINNPVFSSHPILKRE